ncbi:MAG: biopolymer transporter ExbD [Sedimentisphaerales bacterium]|nr:biopolymer transporter ExbD [Sedimentisphaerales bacterium]
MFFRIDKKFRRNTGSFNMTPVIDIVFQLIIFFALVCKFIAAENFPVTVPDGCEFAQSEPQRNMKTTTVTVMKMANDGVAFAVGPEKITAASYAEASEKLAELIDVRLKDLPPEGRIVTLRIDKDVCFAEAQYALAGIAASSATDVQMATLKSKQSDMK